MIRAATLDNVLCLLAEQKVALTFLCVWAHCHAVRAQFTEYLSCCVHKTPS